MKSPTYTLPTKANSLEQRFLNQFITRNISKHYNIYARFGYQYFGPILFGFTIWLHNEIAKNHIKKIYFLARDAEIIMKAYQILYGKKDFLTYLRISRKSILMTEIDHAENFDELCDILKSIIKRTSSIKDLYKILNIRETQYQDKLIFELTAHQKNKIFHAISPELFKYAKKQKKLLKEYLIQNQFSSKIALVDIGWHGTTQYYLSKANPKVDILGYYLGVNLDRNFKQYSSLKRFGYLFDNSSYSSNQSAISLNVGLFETMFLSQEGSTIGYKDEKTGVTPILDSTHTINPDILAIQQAALSFVTDAKTSNHFERLSSLHPETFFSNFKYIATHPKTIIIDLFRKVTFEAHSTKHLISHQPLIKYILNPKRLTIDLNNSYCKVMFLKDTFRLPLPYYKFLNSLYKKTKV